MAIQLFDSLSRSLKPLRQPDPADPKDIFTFYNCGPTVYAPAHIGNFRTFVVNDVLRRLLELEYGKDKVKHVRNLTDVDDKTIRRAREEGRPLTAVTQQWTDKFHADCGALNCLHPHIEPTATSHIREQVDMIEVLMQKGNAYRAADGSVYFKVASFGNYGRLSRVKERELQLGSALAGKSQAADADEKEDATDFALWKAHKPEDGDTVWDSPWGRGRPGWHIECSAMSKKHLGETIDLHTGGEDLLFPHHENEIAQSECCNGVTLARHWYHSKHLLVDGAKMSKSLGNLYTLDDLTAKGYSPMAIRYALLAGHPQKQLDFSLKSLHDAESALQKLRGFAESISIHSGNALSEPSNSGKITDAYRNATVHWVPFWKSLKEDLNIPSALGKLFAHIEESWERIEDNSGNPQWFVDSRDDFQRELSNIGAALFVLGLKLDVPAAPKANIPAAIAALAEKRWAAKQAKDFATADALRKDLTAAGWSMLDRKDGYSLEPIKKL